MLVVGKKESIIDFKGENIMNKETRTFSEFKGRHSAVCNTAWSMLEVGSVYGIEFDSEDLDGDRFAQVYDNKGDWLCHCNCERFTLLGAEE